MDKKKENVFHVISRWFVRWFMGRKYEEKMRDKAAEEEKKDSNVPDDSELIVSPAKQVLTRFLDRKFAVFSVFVVLIMFLVVFIGPKFMPKYTDAYTEVTQKNLPPTRSMMKVPKELDGNIKQIDSYGSFSVGLSNDGDVYVWGVTKLGATSLNVKDIPEEVKEANIVLVAAGLDHVVAFADDGTFYGWGSDRFGQYTRSQANLDNPNLECVPECVLNGEIDPAHIKKLTCGYQATALLMDDGTLYVWGNKQAYNNIDYMNTQTGIVDVDFTLNTIVAIDSKQMSIVTGTRGLYDTVRTSIKGEGEKMFGFLNGRKIEKIAATSTSVAMLLSDGTLCLTGDFPADYVDVPTLKEGEYFTDLQSGTYHFTGLTNLGNVYSFGGNHFYQAEAPSEATGADRIFAGAFQSYALSKDTIQAKWGLKGYLFGTDDVGADIFQRVIAGGRITMTVGAVAVIIEILIGVTIGCISGYFGGWVDIFLMRVAEVFGSIPLYPFMLILSSLLAQVSMSTNTRLFMIMVILGVLGWPGFASITRAQILVARESEYVTAAQAMGV